MPVAVDILSLQEPCSILAQQYGLGARKQDLCCTSDEVMPYKSQYLLEQMHKLSFQGHCKENTVYQSPCAQESPKHGNLSSYFVDL